MDNKITKSRLSHFFSYEWIKIIIFSVVVVLLFELLFAVTGVKLSDGQMFKVIYDQGINSSFENNLIEVTCLDSDGKIIFSYETQKIDAEVMSDGHDNAIDVRYQTRDGDVVITENSLTENVTTGKKTTRAKELIDYFEVWGFEDAVAQGKTYLKRFLKNGVTGEDAELNFSNLDPNKIESYFISTHERDNRFRKQADIKTGVQLELKRIENVCKDVSDMQYLLQNHADIFFKYTKYEQVFSGMTESDRNYNEYKDKYQSQTQKSYAIFTDKLTKGKYKVADFFTVKTADDKIETKDVVVFAFDFSKEQPDLQFESLRFIISVVRNFSEFLNDR